jgi:hypothetical protein
MPSISASRSMRLSDSTHGVMTSFELITVKVTMPTARRAWATPHTTGHNGGAIHHIFGQGDSEVATVSTAS